MIRVRRERRPHSEEAANNITVDGIGIPREQPEQPTTPLAKTKKTSNSKAAAQKAGAIKK